MKRKIINKKLISGILASSMLLGICSCAHKKEPKETVIVYETVIVTATPAPTKEPTNTPVPTSTSTPTPTPIPTNTPTPVPTDTPTPTPKDSTPPTEYHSADDGLDAFWDSIYNKINYINWRIDNTDFDKIKDSTIKYAQELIDFIFYGGEMKGVTFDELQDDAKQKVYEELQKVDAFIMKFIPDYKEKIGEKYNYVKDFASTTLEKAKEIINSHIEVNITKGNSKKKVLKK